MKETLKNCFTGFVAIAALLTLIVACHKDPTPSPTPTPTPSPDSTTIVEPPIDTVTYPDTVWLKFPRPTKAPDMDSVIFYASKNSVKKVIMELETYNSAGWYPSKFKRACDSLQTRIDVNPQKVRGAGTIYTSCIRPDSVTDLAGMHRGDSIALAGMGFDIEYWNKKSR